MYEIYFDGACEPNPGTGSSSFAIIDLSTGATVEEGAKVLDGQSTNNIAEYEALLLALDAAERHKLDNLSIYGDSKLVVEQVHGRWKRKNPILSELREEVVEKLEKFSNWNLEWVSRDKNERADSLSKAALVNVGINPRY